MNARPYQLECMKRITNELCEKKQCIATLFCGTGKSFIMKHGEFTLHNKLTVYVFYSLALISQFTADYCSSSHNKLIISSDSAELATTDPTIICNFLTKNQNDALILVTYQSFNILLDCLTSVDAKISICIFDEAHHITEDNIQPLVFPELKMNPRIEKQVFFTATPVNKNKIIMVRDYEDPDISPGTCGREIYKYSYLDAVQDGFANPIQIRLEFASDKSTCTIYESIARSILITKNSRCLTFHSDVNTERDTSVHQFVNEALFREMFAKIARNEFPERINYYKSIKMVALSASILSSDRKRILNELDACMANEVFVICSCKTIGEGIDTKRANMCVFADPKTSFVEIIQNLGRVVRKSPEQINPSTVLICAHVDKNDFSATDDEDKRNETIMRDMKTPGGNFSSILNVFAAINQEDPLLFKMCIQNQQRFCSEEIYDNLDKQGFEIDEDGICDNLPEIVNNMLINIGHNDNDDDDSLYSNSDISSFNTSSSISNTESISEYLSRIAKKHQVAFELHTNSLTEPIQLYGADNHEIIRIYNKTEDNEILFYPVKQNSQLTRNKNPCSAPKKKQKYVIYVIL